MLNSCEKFLLFIAKMRSVFHNDDDEDNNDIIHYEWEKPEIRFAQLQEMNNYLETSQSTSHFPGFCSFKHALCGISCYKRKCIFKEDKPAHVNSFFAKLDDVHVCTYCLKVFPYPSRLRIHLQSHGIGKVECYVCNCMFTNKYVAIQHSIRCHGIQETKLHFPKRMGKLIERQASGAKTMSYVTPEKRKRRPKRMR